jgi:hypothetical protein
MRDAIDQYLDEVLGFASLARDDERRVRAELKDHLEELATVARQTSSTQKEILAMLNSEFGKPGVVGRAIASARGRLRTYVKKQRTRLPVGLAVALVVAFSIRWAVAEEFRAATSAVAPNVPEGSRMLVYKLASAFHPGDVIVFRSPDGIAMLGVVRSESEDRSALTVGRNGEADRNVAHASVVGRVVLNTR